MATPLNITDAQRDVGLINRFARDTQSAIDQLQLGAKQQQVIAAAAVETAALATLPGNIANGSVLEAGLVVDGILFSQLTCTYTAPTPLGPFAGIFIVVGGYRGNSELVKVGEHLFTGVAGGTVSFNVVLQRTDETITVYFVAKNAQGRTINWALAPSTTVTLDGNNTATVSTVAISTVNASSAFTTSAFISQSGLTTTINISASTAQFGFGTVHYNSGTVNPGGFGTWYIYADDPRYVGGAVTYAATSDFWIANAGEGRLYYGKIITSGGGGGAGGGGYCFTPDVRLLTGKVISKVLVGDFVWVEKDDGQRVLRKVKQVLIHDWNGPMCDMGDGLVTPRHQFRSQQSWQPAENLFGTPAVSYAGQVWNLDIDTDQGDEHNYVLANSKVAHNYNKL